MNTPGFKGSVLEFRDMLYQNTERQGGNQGGRVGEGVDTGATQVLYRQGELRESGNALDVAIDGNGFFVVRDKGETFYTRAGQFQIDDEGFLVDGGSGGRVAALNGSGQLIDINFLGRRVSPAQPTSKITFTGIFSVGSTTHTITDVAVIDAAGTTHKFTLNFTHNQGTRTWLVEVRDETNAILVSSEIKFEPTGTPTEGSNKITFDYAPAGLPSTTVTLDFGDPGSSAGTLLLSADKTDVKVGTQDGFGVGAVTEASFNQNGELTVKYSNGQSNTYERLALARFDNPQVLNPIGRGMFQTTADQTVTYGAPSQDGMGKAMAKNVELSNVQLTEQFTDLVVVQRGYQASSQVISVTNEMIQQLMDIRARR